MLMHEMSVVSNIIKIALQTAEENNLAAVTKIRIKVGSQHHLAPDLMEYAFSFFKKDTAAAEASLEIKKIPVTMECLGCGRTFTVNEGIYICPVCESVQVKMLTGRELIIENIEGETQ